MLLPEQQLLITNEQIATPLAEVLKEITPKAINQPQSIEPSKTLKESLDNLFPEQQYEEKDIQKAKEILGTTANGLTSEQLKDAVTEIRFLAETWLDDFERDIFGGLTLKEMLHEKGRL